MKIVDHAGNSLKVGRLLRWQPNPQQGMPDLYVKVTDVVAPTKDAPGKVEFAVTFGIAPTAKEQGAIQFKDFVTVFDPEDELRAEAALAKATADLPPPIPPPVIEMLNPTQKEVPSGVQPE